MPIQDMYYMIIKATYFLTYLLTYLLTYVGTEFIGNKQIRSLTYRHSTLYISRDLESMTFMM